MDIRICKAAVDGIGGRSMSERDQRLAARLAPPVEAPRGGLSAVVPVVDGRLHLPPEVRAFLDIQAGDGLEFSVRGDKLEVRKVHKRAKRDLRSALRSLLVR